METKTKLLAIIPAFFLLLGILTSPLAVGQQNADPSFSKVQVINNIKFDVYVKILPSTQTIIKHHRTKKSSSPFIRVNAGKTIDFNYTGNSSYKVAVNETSEEFETGIMFMQGNLINIQKPDKIGVVGTGDEDSAFMVTVNLEDKILKVTIDPKTQDLQYRGK